MIKIQEGEIDISEVIKNTRSEEAGALTIFIGTVRNKSKDRSVDRLEYDSYDKMVISEIEEIFKKATERWPIIKCSIIHRKGILEIGEMAVAIGVSTPHRKESFEACQFIIDTLKKTVPIWKKEIFEDGEEWIMPNP